MTFVDPPMTRPGQGHLGMAENSLAEQPVVGR
jgi:hypothetical protein